MRRETRKPPARASGLRAGGIVESLIVRQGLSYVDAIEWCERWGEEAAAPYREAAAIIRDWLNDGS